MNFNLFLLKLSSINQQMQKKKILICARFDETFQFYKKFNKIVKILELSIILFWIDLIQNILEVYFLSNIFLRNLFIKKI